jgi:hypothetical protein
MSGIAVLADVPLGHGSPQALRIAASLQSIFGEPATVLAPVAPAATRLAGAAEAAAARAGVGLIELDSGEPFSHTSGQIVHAMLAGDYLNRAQPRVVVVCAFIAAPALLRLRRKPPVCIFYGYEHLDGEVPWYQQTFAALEGWFDLAVFPEEHRAALDMPRLKLERTPATILLNSVEPLAAVVPAEQRTGRAIYAGLLDPVRTAADALLGPEFAHVPLDVFGRLEGFDHPQQLDRELRARGGPVRFHGHSASDGQFHARLASASVAISLWQPLSESTLFACPNKFFEAISLGVPPVIGPHPQAARLISSLGCGVLAKSFAPSDVRAAVEATLSLQGSAAYEALIEACVRAHADALSWSHQERKLKTVLDQLKLTARS